MSRRFSAKVWAPALVAIGCLVGLGVARIDPVVPKGSARAPRAPEISAEGRALLGGLKVGDRLVGWTVEALDGPREGMLRIDLGRDEVGFALMVVGKGQRSESPPVQTEGHMIFYGHARPPELELPQGTIRATTHALARRVRANEASVEVPGL